MVSDIAGIITDEGFVIFAIFRVRLSAVRALSQLPHLWEITVIMQTEENKDNTA